jgi:Mce-associated membrane protein
MTTTRHHINRQRRRQARETRPAASAGGPQSTGGRIGTRGTAVLSPSDTAGAPPSSPARQAEPDTAGDKTVRARPRRPVGLAVLCALTVLLGGFAGWAHAEAEALRDTPARSNTALTDLARTSEIKGQAAKAVDRLFSYDHADPGALGKAAKDLLTGKAVNQHRDLLADVRARADEQKAVITTTVTESAVERIDGDRARVLVYADQSSVATTGDRTATGRAGTADKAGEGENAAKDEGVYAAAMVAVDVVHRDGRWLVSGIDTFGR